QGGGKQAGGMQTKDAGLGDDSSLEQDADRSAVGAVVSAWTGAKKGLAEIGANALPRLKSSFKLQKFSNCDCHKKTPEAEAVKRKIQADPPGFKQALEAHKAQQSHVKNLLDTAQRVPRNTSTEYAILQNSLEWIKLDDSESGKTPADQSQTRKTKG